LLGIWTSPGDFGEKKGTYTPDWWRAGTEYGLLKTIRITREGSKLDGISLSNVNIDMIPIQYGKDMSFRIAVPEDAANKGGINIFGKGFGNYNQDIDIRVEYD
jgi:predicted transcriptional regulator